LTNSFFYPRGSAFRALSLVPLCGLLHFSRDKRDKNGGRKGRAASLGLPRADVTMI